MSANMDNELTLRRSTRTLALMILGTALCYAIPLLAVVRLASETSLYSHILLVPFISAYLLYTSKARKALEPGRAVVPALACYVLAAMLAILAAFPNTAAAEIQDRLALATFSFVTATQGHVLLVMGSRSYKALLTPLLFLYFMTPLPARGEAAISSFLQSGTVPVLHVLLKSAGTTFFHTGTQFEMPGLAINVAPECSGIRSTLVLVITAVLGGYIFLRTAAMRTALVLLAVGVGIFRNALRIFTLCMLTMHVNPSVIEGPLHSQGGPPFFIVSLGILLAVIIGLRRIETRRSVAKEPAQP